jgi:3-deoxy-D-manno-octulosonic-acid transferase
LLVLVPRHPDRFDKVATLCAEAGFSLVRRSQQQPPAPEHQILLGDTMGELMQFYGACDIAFVGGSLVPVGGHNLLEPAAWAIPVLSGPSLFNFAEASSLLLAAGGLQLCDSPAEIAQAVSALLENKARGQEMGAAALAVVAENRGALERLLAGISGIK